ncbi:hypothetical protein OSTOST_12263, partial [Ostertagia ostertagi]
MVTSIRAAEQTLAAIRDFHLRESVAGRERKEVKVALALYATAWGCEPRYDETPLLAVTAVNVYNCSLPFDHRPLLCDRIRILFTCGYIHRDIKPPNFAIGREADGDLHTIYIIDFGLSRKY